MYLKQLVLKGFKSFADRSVLSLEPGITAIVGPNGSGKSNILDAVLWVLGERNARNLRGQAMEDVIFAGSASRKPVGVAEVDLVLDNGDHVLPVDFDEVAVTRRMYRSGESEYLINGTVCRRMDVMDLLHDSGLGTGTHSIISQGHLDAVLQSKPEDRRTLVEEAAGVLKHKQRKEKSARKLARMEQHLLRVQDVTAEVARQLKPLERKAKKARTYKEVSAELTDLSLRLAVDDLRALQKRWDGVVADEATQKERLNKAQLSAYASDSTVRDLQQELQRHRSASGQAAEGLHRLQSSAQRIDSTTLLLREKRRSVERAREENLRRVEDDENRLRDAKDERAKAQTAFEGVKRERDEADARLARAKERNDAASAALSGLQQELSRLQSDEQRLTAAGDRLRAEKARAAEALSNSMADDKLLAARQQDLAERTGSVTEKLDGLKQEGSDAARALADAQERDTQARAATGQAFADVEKRRAWTDELRMQASKLRARAAALKESEDTHRQQNGAVAWMADHAGEYGAQGMLVDVIDVPEDVSALVDRLLGTVSLAPFAQDAHGARAALHGLADSGRTGMAAVISRKASAAEGLPAVPESGQLLIDRLTFPDEYAPAIRALLGDVIVCDSWEDAAAVEDALAASPVAYRVATRDGYVGDARGLRRFSRVKEGTVGAVERHRQLSDALRAADDAEAAAATAQDELSNAQEALRALQKDGADAASALAQARGRDESLRAQIVQAQKEADGLEEERRTLERRRSDVASVLEQMKPASERAESELQRSIEQLAHVKSALGQCREKLEPVRAEAAAASEAYTKLRLEASTLAERCTYSERLVVARDRDIAQLEQRISHIRTAQARKQSPQALDPAIRTLSLIRESVTGRIDAQERGMEQAKTASEGIHARIDEARRTSSRLHGEMDDATAKLADVRVEKGRLEVQVQHAVDSIEKDRNTPLDRAMELPRIDDREQAQIRVDKLRRRIANMGTINPDAAQEYEELKERYDYLKGQTEDLLAARRSLRKIVEVIDDRMKDDFIDTYHAVNKNFQEIFAELFPGGSAALSLVNEQDPEHSGIEVHAQPRGKRIAKLSLMSGGEKSLTALALLFAVYKTRATPFYILDEVEAALDDTNLRRLCAYWQKMRKDTQLIMITHQRRTMEMADVLYGISMQADGVTRLLSQRLDQAMRSEDAQDTPDGARAGVSKG